jgi:exonuclease SbcD
MRDMRHLKGPIEKLLDRENITSPEDFIYATLTNEDIIDDAMGIMQQVYPNTVKIDYDNSRTREIERIDIANIAEQKSFDELIGDFYRKMYGCDISEEEMQVMKEAAKEAGVIDETD